MAFTPIQTFNKEDFPELKGEEWADRLFTKLNEFTRQTQYSLAGNLGIEQNISGFYHDIRLMVDKKDPDVLYPYTEPADTPPTPKQSATVKGFPFTIKNKMLPKKAQSVMVCYADDVTAAGKISRTALAFGVAWTEVSDGISIDAVGGLLAGRVYDMRFLVLCE